MMADRDDGDSSRTEPKLRRSRWPGWIWAIPIAALAIVVWLGARSLLTEGPTVTVTFASANGVAPGDTKVRYRGIQVGEVDDVKLSDDHREVVVTLQMESGTDALMKDGTKLWIVGGQISLRHLSALKTVISGPYIEVEPGGGKPRDHFKGLDQPPPIQAHEGGTRYALRSDRLGSISKGSSVFYRGLDVGTVTDDKLAADGSGFDIDIFIRKPYDRLVNGSTRFWDASAVDVNLGSNGLSARLTSIEALTAGAIAFETPSRGTPKAETGPRKLYKLYKDRKEAELAPAGPGVSYVLHFDGTVGDLSVGAPVRLMGFSIGEVTHVSLSYDRQKGTLDMPVTVELDPSRVGLDGAGQPAGASPVARMNDMLGHLVAKGLRAKMTKDPPFVGGESVSLEFEKNPPPATLQTAGGMTEIPTTSSDDISSLAKSASSVVTEIRNLPLAQIGEDIRQASDRIKMIANAPQIMQSIDHLDKTLAHLEKETGAIQGQVGPMVDAMRKAAEDAQQAVASANAILGGRGRQEGNIPAALRDLSDAARSIRALADYLDRNPGALLRGRTGEQQ